jgi:hypothetical protein
MLYEKYPELKQQAPNVKTYKRLDERGIITEMWEKDENGKWIDVTDRERKKQELAAAQKEYELLLKRLDNLTK